MPPYRSMKEAFLIKKYPLFPTAILTCQSKILSMIDIKLECSNILYRHPSLEYRTFQDLLSNRSIRNKLRNTLHSDSMLRGTCADLKIRFCKCLLRHCLRCTYSNHKFPANLIYVAKRTDSRIPILCRSVEEEPRLSYHLQNLFIYIYHRNNSSLDISPGHTCSRGSIEARVNKTGTLPAASMVILFARFSSSLST